MIRRIRKLARYPHAEGYSRIRVMGKLILEHRAVMGAVVGRKLKTVELVHHTNENKLDNSSGNLEIRDNSTHAIEHARKRFHEGNVKLTCSICGKRFYRRRSRAKRPKGNGRFCSRDCWYSRMRLSSSG